MVELKKSRQALGFEVEKNISDNPEKKDQILKLNNSWAEFIKSKCNFETIESKGTDAELASFNQCVAIENNKELEYFKHLHP